MERSLIEIIMMNRKRDTKSNKPILLNYTYVSTIYDI